LRAGAFADRHDLGGTRASASPMRNGAVTSAVLMHQTRGTGPLRLALTGATRSGAAGVEGLSRGPLARLRRTQMESIGTFRRNRRLETAGWERAMDKQTKHEILLLAIGTMILEVPAAVAAFVILSH
jgi:hypothetical protein